MPRKSRKVYAPKPCAFKPCSTIFQPRVWWQEYCCEEHRLANFHVREAERYKATSTLNLSDDARRDNLWYNKVYSDHGKSMEEINKEAQKVLEELERKKEKFNLHSIGYGSIEDAAPQHDPRSNPDLEEELNWIEEERPAYSKRKEYNSETEQQQDPSKTDISNQGDTQSSGDQSSPGDDTKAEGEAQ
jgi:hypothetical protein